MNKHSTKTAFKFRKTIGSLLKSGKDMIKKNLKVVYGKFHVLVVNFMQEQQNLENRLQ